MLRIVLVFLFVIAVSSCASHEQESDKSSSEIEVTSHSKEITIELNAIESIARYKGSGKGPVADNTNNNAPVISGEPPTNVTIDQQYYFTVSANDADGDRLQFDILNMPNWLTFNRRHGTLSGTPLSSDAGFFENIIISVSDGIDFVALPPFSIMVVTPEITNLPPIIESGVINVNEDSSKLITIPVTDPDSDSVELVLSKTPQFGNVQISTNSHDVIYTPRPDYHGSDSFVLSAVDPYGASSSAEFFITIAPVNDIPNAQVDSFTAVAAEATMLDVLLNDTGLGDGSLKLEIQSPPGQGTVAINSDGTINYTSNINAQTSDSFTYKVSDVDNDSAIASVNVTIASNCSSNCEAVVTASWAANNEPDIQGYFLYHGNTSGEYSNEIWVGSVTTFKYSVPAVGSHFFALKAQNKIGLLSDYSEEIVLAF